MNSDFYHKNNSEQENNGVNPPTANPGLPPEGSPVQEPPIPVQAEISHKEPEYFGKAESSPKTTAMPDSSVREEEAPDFSFQDPSNNVPQVSDYTAPQNQMNPPAATGQQSPAAYQYKPQYYTPAANYEYRAQSGSPQQTQKPKKEKKPKNKMARILVATVAVCTVASLALGGVGGALVTNYLLQNNTVSSRSSLNSGSDSSASSGSGTVYTNSSGTDGALSVSDIVNKVGDSVVAIDVSTSSGEFKDIPSSSSSSGSGVIISSDGYIVTNNHVVSGGNTIKVYLKNGDSYDAKIIGTDKTTDLALLKIEATDLIFAQFGDSSTLQVGETAVAIGNPLGLLHGTATTGIISALDRELTIDNETMNLLQTDASISPGNSGGGLFNGKGELIGIVNAKSSAQYAEGIGFAIPINDVKPVVEALKENGYVTGRPVIGVSMIDISTQAMANMYRVDRLGTYVYDVEDDGPAAQAGLQSGDCIVSVNGQNVSTSAEVSQIVKESSVGDKMTFVVYRQDRQMTITVTVGEKTSTQTNS